LTLLVGKRYLQDEARMNKDDRLEVKDNLQS